LDLRSRVIAASQSGDHGSWEELAATFRIGRATVNRLIRRFRETGSVEPAPHGGGLEPLMGRALERLSLSRKRRRPSRLPSAAGRASSKHALRS
jgi:transposase